MDVLTAFEANKTALARFIQRIHHDASVEDVLQETFLNAYKAERKAPILQPRPFLFRIAKHVALNKLALQRRWSAPSDIDVEDARHDASPEEEIIAGEAAELLMERVNMLSEQTRRVYWLRVEQELSYKQISACLGISTSTVEKHCIRVHKLQREFNSKE